MNNNCTCHEPIGGTSKFYMPGEIKIVISSAVKFNGYFKYGDLGLFDHIFHSNIFKLHKIEHSFYVLYLGCVGLQLH